MQRGVDEQPRAFARSVLKRRSRNCFPAYSRTPIPGTATIDLIRGGERPITGEVECFQPPTALGIARAPRQFAGLGPSQNAESAPTAFGSSPNPSPILAVLVRRRILIVLLWVANRNRQ